LESIIRQRRGELTLAITDNEWELLRQVIQQKKAALLNQAMMAEEWSPLGI
jgi:hypothetical protein